MNLLKFFEMLESTGALKYVQNQFEYSKKSQNGLRKGTKGGKEQST